MRRLLLPLVLATALQPARPLAAQPAEALSDSAAVSLLTMLPGEEVYSRFGHSAFRIHDPALRLDRTYNFGTFDFEQPFFMVRFARGQLDYLLDTAPYAEEVFKYRYLRRPVVEQHLALPPEAVRALYAMLEENLLPENRAYRYDFFYDNCSTRLLVALDRALVAAGRPPLTLHAPYAPRTFRALLQPYLDGVPLLDLGTDLGLGLPTDRLATAREATFLPVELMRQVEAATTGGRRLVARTDTLFQVPGYAATHDAFDWAILAHPRSGPLGMERDGLGGNAEENCQPAWASRRRRPLRRDRGGRVDPRLPLVRNGAHRYGSEPQPALGLADASRGGVGAAARSALPPSHPLLLRHRCSRRTHRPPLAVASPGVADTGLLSHPLSRLPRDLPREPQAPNRLTMPSVISTTLSALHIGNGHAPALPVHLTPDRLRALARQATYAPDVLDRPTLTVRAPFTGEVVTTLPAAGPEDVAFASAQARAAQPAWAARPFSERARVFARLHDLVLGRCDEALDLIQLESGKTRFDAFLEVADVAVVSRYYAYHGEAPLVRTARPGLVPLLTQVEVNRVPLGVVGVIAPWNYPLTMAISDAIPALLAGNAVVVKPAELTPFTALWAAALLEEAGLPPGLLHLVPGDGPTLGPALIGEADFIHFTGSTEVGRIVAQGAAERLVGCSLELGGKNPLLVLEDADLDKAVEGAVRACFSSAGQLCISAERLYVHRAVFDAFLDRFRLRAEALVVRPGYDWEAEMGSLTSREQLDKVTAHVEDALAKGATLVTGGYPIRHLGPYFYAPTILTGVTPEMTLYDEETFGPVAAVYPFDADDEVVALANDSAYGLHASVWTRDVRRGQRVARRLRCGTVGVNDPYTAAWGSTAAPMGGFGQSGLGRRHGPEGITKYTEAQTVATQHLLPIAPLAGMAVGAFAGALVVGFQVLRRLPGLR